MFCCGSYKYVLLIYLNNNIDEDELRNSVRLVTARNGQIRYGFEGNIFNSISICNLKISNGTVYSLYPKSNVTDPRFTINGYNCEFKLKNVRVEDIGTWVLDVDQREFMGNYMRIIQPLEVMIEGIFILFYNKVTCLVVLDLNIYKNTFYFLEKVTPFPAKSIEVYEGQNIHISLSESVPNFIECSVNYPGNYTYVSNDDKCVSTIKAELGMSGMWKMNGTGEILLYSEVNVTVKGNKTDINLQ